MKSSATDSEGVGLLPGDGRPPGVQPHLVGQRLGDGQQDEADVGQRDERGQQHHQVVSVPSRKVRADGRARHQAGCERGRNLREETAEDLIKDFRSAFGVSALTQLSSALTKP